MAGLKCRTCGELISDVKMGLLRDTDRGSRPVRRGSFKFVHRGDCDVPAEGGSVMTSSWDLASLVEDPDQIRYVVRDALLGTGEGRTCFSDGSLLAVVRAINPDYPLEELAHQLEQASCG